MALRIGSFITPRQNGTKVGTTATSALNASLGHRRGYQISELPFQSVDACRYLLARSPLPSACEFTNTNLHRGYFPMQNWLKIESRISSVVVFPTISPMAFVAILRSIAANSSV